MKKLLLSIVTFVWISVGLNASNTNSNYYYTNTNQQFTFVERGITYAVFQNGEFDFFMNRPNGVSINYNSSNFNLSFNSGYNYNAYVQYDNYGAVIQIENTPIYYDHYGRVSRIGNVNINYYNGRLVQLGGMHVYYNNYGYYSYNRGYINRYNMYYSPFKYAHCFVQPHYNYRVVSYKPYRHHYKPHRYHYHKDHSKNKYYSRNQKHYKKGHYNHSNYKKSHSNYGKRESTYTNNRIATNVPKRKEQPTRNESRTSKSRESHMQFGNNYDKIRNNTSRMNTSITHRNTSTSKTRNTSKSVNNRNIKPERVIAERKPETRVDKRKQPIRVDSRKSVSTSERNSRNIEQSKRKNTQYRKPVNQEKNTSRNSRKI